MKPNEEYGQSIERENYSREDRTECLVLCSGLGGIHPLKIRQNAPYHLLQQKPTLLSRNKLSVMLNYDNLNTNGARNGMYPSKRKPNVATPSPKNMNPRIPSIEPHLVKVSVYSKVVNPYIVIYDSTLKYAKPTAYLKLSSYKAFPGGSPDAAAQLDNELDCSFRLLPNKHDDVDNSNVITFRAPSKTKRDEWVNYLNGLSMGKTSSGGCKRGSSYLPTLLEEENVEEDSNAVLETFRKQTPQSRRLRRRGSLNSLGIRLRCYNIIGNAI